MCISNSVQEALQQALAFAAAHHKAGRHALGRAWDRAATQLGAAVAWQQVAR